MDLQRYIAETQRRLVAAMRLPEWALVSELDQLYRRAFPLVPREPKHLLFPRALLLAHKHLVSAAATTGEGRAEDAGPVTRRAIEMMCLVLAVKQDPEKYERWARPQEWADRYEKFLAGEIPTRRLNFSFFDFEHELRADLKANWILLSEGESHFLPAYLEGQPWRVKDDGSDVVTQLLDYFRDEGDEREGLLNLAQIHGAFLSIFDQCFDRALSADVKWRSRMAAFAARLGRMTDAATEAEPARNGPTPSARE